MSRQRHDSAGHLLRTGCWSLVLGQPARHLGYIHERTGIGRRSADASPLQCRNEAGTTLWLHEHRIPCIDGLGPRKDPGRRKTGHSSQCLTEAAGIVDSDPIDLPQTLQLQVGQTGQRAAEGCNRVIGLIRGQPEAEGQSPHGPVSPRPQQKCIDRQFAEGFERSYG